MRQRKQLAIMRLVALVCRVLIRHSSKSMNQNLIVEMPPPQMNTGPSIWHTSAPPQPSVRCSVLTAVLRNSQLGGGGGGCAKQWAQLVLHQGLVEGTCMSWTEDLSDWGPPGLEQRYQSWQRSAFSCQLGQLFPDVLHRSLVSLQFRLPQCFPIGLFCLCVQFWNSPREGRKCMFHRDSKTFWRGSTCDGTALVHGVRQVMTLGRPDLREPFPDGSSGKGPVPAGFWAEGRASWGHIELSTCQQRACRALQKQGTMASLPALSPPPRSPTHRGAPRAPHLCAWGLQPGCWAARAVQGVPPASPGLTPSVHEHRPRQCGPVCPG